MKTQGDAWFRLRQEDSLGQPDIGKVSLNSAKAITGNVEKIDFLSTARDLVAA